MQNQTHILTLIKKLMIKIINLMLCDNVRISKIAEQKLLEHFMKTNSKKQIIKNLG